MSITMAQSLLDVGPLSTALKIGESKLDNGNQTVISKEH